MKKIFAAVSVLLFTALQASAAAPQKSVETMTCDLKNFLGFAVGSVEMTSDEPLVINFGLASNELVVTKVTQNEVLATDAGKVYEFAFVANDPLNRRQKNYDGVLYQQYVKGALVGPRIPLALFNCELVLK